MMRKKIIIARKVLKEKGLLGFLIASLQYIEKRTSRRKRSNPALKQIYTKANWNEIIAANLDEPMPVWQGTAKKKMVFNWLMPPPGKGSGGHMTLFRFISFLEDAGHSCNLYFYIPGSQRGSVAAVKAIMGDSFPPVKAKMYWYVEGDEFVKADAIFATSWETAYPVRNAKLNAKRFYFVQDFEPYFYPVGSLSVLAENTYKLGFYGITAGGWLADKLHADYGMKTDHITFGSDSKVYTFENDTKRREIMFYARPYTERRGFELGLLALDLFHKMHPEYVINFVGWDVSEYDIPFPYKNLKVLEHDELSMLYNRCAAGLVMSLTNMSLLPLELLACGTIPVVNEGPNNRLVSDNKYIAYSHNDPNSLARTLSDIVRRENDRAYAKEASRSAANASWEESGKKFVRIIEREMRKKG